MSTSELILFEPQRIQSYLRGTPLAPRPRTSFRTEDSRNIHNFKQKSKIDATIHAQYAY